KKTGGPLNFDITVALSTGSATPEFFQSQLKQFSNVNVSVHTIDPTQTITFLQQGTFNLFAYTQAFADPGVSWSAFFGTGGNRNFGKYSNPTLDADLAKGNAAVGTQARVKAFAPAQKLINDNVLYLFLYPQTDFNLLNPKVQNLV